MYCTCTKSNKRKWTIVCLFYFYFLFSSLSKITIQWTLLFGDAQVDLSFNGYFKVHGKKNHFDEF